MPEPEVCGVGGVVYGGVTEASSCCSRTCCLLSGRRRTAFMLHAWTTSMLPSPVGTKPVCYPALGHVVTRLSGSGIPEFVRLSNVLTFGQQHDVIQSGRYGAVQVCEYNRVHPACCSTSDIYPVPSLCAPRPDGIRHWRSANCWRLLLQVPGGVHSHLLAYSYLGQPCSHL